MTDQPQTPTGPDLADGTPADSISDGVPLLGHVGGDPVILVRRGVEMFAIGAMCSHYRGPLAEGLVVDDTVRCPFFWSQHYDLSINYVGHAERWDAIDVDGSFERHDCSVRYRAGRRVLAMASLFRDRESLEAELAMEREVA